MEATQLDSGPAAPLTRARTLRIRRLGRGATSTRATHLAVGSDAGAARQQPEEFWNDHGRYAYALACALLGDEPAAARAVALGMVDFARSDLSPSAPETRRALARHVYWRSTELTADTTDMQHLPPAMVRLAQLARLQRTCLALCLFGGHNHQQVAGLLGVPALTVAELLTSGLQELTRLRTAEATIGS